MIRYTVTIPPIVEDDLARIWIEATNRQLISRAADAIDSELREDATIKGEEGHEGLRRLTIHPLQVQFTVEESDRMVTIWSVRLIGPISGHP